MLKIRFELTLGVYAVVGLLATALTVKAVDEKFPVLEAAGEVYSNVTVTAVTATDIYFTHAGGMGNAKLKNLDPKLRKIFKFDPIKAGEIEKKQREGSAQYRQALATNGPTRVAATEAPVELDENGDLVVKTIYARSFRGQRPPQIVVDQWLTAQPEVQGKFVLVEFWRAGAAPSVEIIPHLNDLASRFAGQLVIIALTDEAEEAVRKSPFPPINYHVGVDTQARTLRAVGVERIPHAILMDPKGIVRFEGVPGLLDAKQVRQLIDKYSN